MKKVAAIILENDKGEILLYLRDNKPGISFPNHWDLFGGYVEEGESIEQALLREVKEELNYELKEYSFFKEYAGGEEETIKNRKYVFLGRINLPIEQIKLNEGERLQYFAKTEIENVKFANILKAIVMDYIQTK